MTTATKISKAMITRKLNAKGFQQARWIQYGVKTTEGFWINDEHNNSVAVDYFNNGGIRDIDDAFIERQVRKITNMATYLEGEGFKVEIKSSDTTGLLWIQVAND